MRTAILILLALMAGTCNAHAESSPAASPVKRLGDTALEFAPEWQRCQQDSDCVLVGYGCGEFTAAHKDHKDPAQERAWEKGGDSRAMNCIWPDKSRTPVEALCRDGLCGAWQYDLCLNPPDCTQTLPECQIETYFYADIENDDTYGYSLTNLFGPVPEMCHEKCEHHWQQYLAHVRGLATPESRMSMACLFGGDRVIDERVVGGDEYE